MARRGSYEALGDVPEDIEMKKHRNISRKSRFLSVKYRERAASIRQHAPYVFLLGMLTAVAYVIYLTTSTDAFAPERNIDQLSLREWQKGIYSARVRNVNWLSDGSDGEYLVKDDHGWTVAKWPDRDSRKILNATISYEGEDRRVDTVKLNRQRTHAIVATDTQKHWRHSSFSMYWLVDLETGAVSRIHEGPLSIVEWSPKGGSLAFVRQNDVYIHTVTTQETIRLTEDGGEDIFNGIPDWVYEEEVFTGNTALWWSVNGTYLAFLRTNDSAVPKFPIPYFISSHGHESAYPELSELKYPKPGFPNPEVTILIYDTQNGDSAATVSLETDIDELIVTECVWVGDSQLLVKVMDRESDRTQVHIIHSRDATAILVRENTNTGSERGWFEVTHNTHFVPSDPDKNRSEDGYVDTVTSEDGFNHLGYFSPPDSKEPLILSSGNWEVDDVEYAINLEDNYVYFTSTMSSPIERSINRVSLIGGNVETVSAGESGMFSAKYSPDGKFALITHRPPSSALSQKVIRLDPNATTKDGDVIEDNSALNKLLESRNLGEVRYGQIEVAPGILVNYREILPSGFSERKKHPLLFFNYGGPGSQQVQKQLTLDFQRIFAETHNAVVVTIDPRGTGFMGKHFRSVVRDRLGHYESHDVIAAAKLWNRKSYVDEETTAIWGWSYGGYLTLKVLEQDDDLAFKYGVAVAPVTDWSLYDSIYTERYMHTPEHNSAGYVTSSITNVTNLGRHKRFLIMHGTGDDNVHFQNTLVLLDKLDLNNVENYDVHVFPDSDHSISFHNAQPIVYDKIDSWLREHQEHNR